MRKKDLLFILLLFVSWRLVLFVIAIWADTFLPYLPSFPYAFTLLPQFNLPRFIYSFANFDGVHYLTIAKEGYLRAKFIQAFFPLYPYLIRIPTLFFPSINPITLGLLLSNGSFLGALILGFDLIRRQFDRATAYRFLIVLLLFPTSFFFGSLYTESLFLLLVLGTFWGARQKYWFLSALCAMLASSTRIIGILLVPALLVELWIQSQSSQNIALDSLRKFIQTQWKTIALISIGSLGLLAYMLFLHQYFADSLYFIHVQSEFGAGRSENLVLYPQVVYRSVKIILTNSLNLKYIPYIQEFITGTLGLVGILLIAKKVPLSWTVFTIVGFLIPPLTGSFLSMPRFILICFPLFIGLALLSKRLGKFEFLFWGISFLLLLLNSLLFIQGYWVA